MDEPKGVANVGPVTPGPLFCIVCQDRLLAFEEKNTSLTPIVAVRCGHLFHTKCLNGWFKSISWIINGDPALKPCPYCRRVMRWCDTKRIFPVNGEHPKK